MEELTLEEVEVFRVCAHSKPVVLKIHKVQKPHQSIFLLLLAVQGSSQDHEDLL